MDFQNLTYTLVQLAHNFGAVAIVGLSWYGWRNPPAAPVKLAAWIALAWAVQIASGAGFGATSVYYYGQFPDIHGVAIVALGIKVAAALAGLVLALIFIGRSSAGADTRTTRVWAIETLLGSVALAAAAFLRWFS